MEYRRLGRSGLMVSALSFGAMGFGGKGEFFNVVGNTQLPEATRIIDRCMDAGINFFDTADVYSFGQSEQILGAALGRKRKDAIITTKAFNRYGHAINDVGCSRRHLIRACERSIKSLGSDYIDVYLMHIFDELTPLEETLRAMDDLVRDGKVRYIGCSNYSAWHLMKACSISEREGLERMVVQQIFYSLIGREAELEHIPVSIDQGVGLMIHGPMGGGLLSGKYRRGQPDPEGARGVATRGPGKGTGGFAVPDREQVYNIVEVLDRIAKERNVPIPQVAYNYLLAKPGVTSVLIGARDENQLENNIGATEWKLTHEEMRELDAVSDFKLPSPYNRQAHYGKERNPYWAARNA